MPGGDRVAGKSVVIAILADTKKFASDIDGAAGKADGFGGVLAGLGKAAAAGLAVAGAAAVGFIAMSVKAAAEAEKVTAQTQAVLNSTAGAANRSAAQISKLAGQLSALSGVDDEVIQSGQNVLLTFTRIQGTNFDRATQAALDLSVAMGTDLNAASLLVGKALNDPIKGMSALGRAGVQLTDEQRALVEQLVATGDVAGAQAILLEELNTQFGGSAEAFGRTFEGALGRVKTIFGNLQETVGGALLPVLTVVLGRVADFLTLLQESTAFTTFISNLTNFANGLLNGTTGLSDLGGVITAGIKRGADWLANGGVTTIVQALVSGRAAMFDAGMQVFPAIVDAIVAVVPQVLVGISTMLTGLVSLLVTSLPMLLQGAVTLFVGLAKAVGVALPSIVKSVVGIIPTLVSTLVSMVPDLLAGAISLFSALINAVVTILPVLIEAIIGMLPGILTSLVSLIPMLIEGAISLFMALVQAIPVVLPMLIQAIVDLIPIVITTLIELIPVLLDAAVQLMLAIVDAIPVIIPALINAVISLIPAIIGALIGAIPKIIGAGVQLMGGLIDAVGRIVPRLVRAGAQVVQGLWDGISNGWRDFMRWWSGNVAGVVNTVKSLFGIASPSRVFAGIGVNVVKGLERGLAGPNRIGALMAGLSSDVERGFSARLDAPAGYRAGGGGRQYTITVQAIAPNAEVGRAVVQAIDDYERIGGAA
jgi:phage-related protein